MNNPKLKPNMGFNRFVFDYALKLVLSYSLALIVNLKGSTNL